MMKQLIAIILSLVWIIPIQAENDYNPTNPTDPYMTYKVTARVTPVGAGTATTNGMFAEGQNIFMNTSASSTNYKFLYWTLNGEKYTEESSFEYTAQSISADFIAVYEEIDNDSEGGDVVYDPTNPADPYLNIKEKEQENDEYYTLNFASNIPEACSFNITNGVSIKHGTFITIECYGNQNFDFVGWYKGNSLVSKSTKYTFCMTNNTNLVAKYKVYSPMNPNDPYMSNIRINYSSVTLEGGEKITLSVMDYDKQEELQGIEWSSANPEIATVSNTGTVKGVTKGQTVITGVLGESQFTCEVQVVSDINNDVALPDIPFEFNYNFREYDSELQLCPNNEKAMLADYNLRLFQNKPMWDEDHITISDIVKGYIDKWESESTSSGDYFYRAGSENVTIITKVAPILNRNNSGDFITNRYGGYNYMFRIAGENNSFYFHTGTAYQEDRSIIISSSLPQVLAVRVNGKENYIQLDNLTTGEALRINDVNWGGSFNAFKFFYNNDWEFYAGDVYWIYYSFELLGDEDITDVIDYNDGVKSAYILGDVDSDGIITMHDANMVVNHYLGNKKLTNITAADVDKDGNITMSDANKIVNMYLNKK